MSIMEEQLIRFEFEDFLEKHEEKLPQGLDPLYLNYIHVVDDPIHNLKKLPRALSVLPMNAVIHQSWGSLMVIYGLLVFLSLPTLSLFVYASSLYNLRKIGVTMNLFILLGALASLWYLKKMYLTISDLTGSKKNTWLISDIKHQFIDAYETKWNRRWLKISFIISIIPEVYLLYVIFSATIIPVTVPYVILISFLVVLGHFGFSLMLYISLIAFRYVSLNTGIYDKLLGKIMQRVEGYTFGNESILNKKNYEVIRVLSDTPGLSIQSLSDIPVYGLLSAIFTLNGAIFMILTPFFIKGPIANVIASFPNLKGDNTNLTYVLLIGIFISSLAAFGAVIRPLFRISSVIGKFKRKALSELDPFLFEEITTLALNRDAKISNETQIIYIIRSYIYSMKVSPVPPLKLIQIVLMALLYGFKIMPTLISIL